MARRLLAALLAASLLLPLARPDSTSSRPATTAYDELRLRGFPRGLLPANVRAYTLDAGSGDFAVDLRSSCRIVLPAGSYLAAFSDRLTGRLDDRRISGLDGIRVRAFFRWWSITGIRADGDQLVFEVGSVSAKFPARDFNASLDCPAQAATCVLGLRQQTRLLDRAMHGVFRARLLYSGSLRNAWTILLRRICVKP